MSTRRGQREKIGRALGVLAALFLCLLLAFAAQNAIAVSEGIIGSAVDFEVKDKPVKVEDADVDVDESEAGGDAKSSNAKTDGADDAKSPSEADDAKSPAEADDAAGKSAVEADDDAADPDGAKAAADDPKDKEELPAMVGEGAEDKAIELADASDYPSTLQNGSFENPTGYPGTNMWNGYTSVPSWNTTATDKKIEVAWVLNPGTSEAKSKHMKALTSYQAADGYRFIETVSNEKYSSVYHTFTATAGQTYTLQFSHRGRTTKVDVVAAIIGPVQQYSFDKTAAADVDVFSQIVSWLKASTDLGTHEFSGGESVRVDVYSTELSARGVFDTSSAASAFSAEPDDDHTVHWQVILCGSNNVDWNTFSVNVVLEQAENVVAFAAWHGYNQKDLSDDGTSGNLLDLISVKDSSGVEAVETVSFEALAAATDRYKNVNAANSSNPHAAIQGWCTTATTKIIEVGNVENGASNVYGLPATILSEVSVPDGYQFAELNCNEESSLYQYINTSSGKKYTWSLFHRGREGIDTMALVIGPKQDYDPKKQGGKSGRDQLMQIVDWMKTQDEVIVEKVEGSGCSQEYVLFTTKFNDVGGYTSAQSGSAFSWSEDAEHTERWNVWIISSDNDRWYEYGAGVEDADYSCSYIIPANTPVSVFGFVSYEPSPRTSGGTIGTIDYSFGNMLDCVQFSEYYHVIANTTEKGSGIIEVGDTALAFTANENYSGWALSESEFKIVACVDDRNFVGAIVNDQFIEASSWTLEPDGTYSYIFENVHEHYDVRLVFAAEHVIYNTNGGDSYHYNPADESTGYEVPMNSEAGSNVYVSHAATSSTDGWMFQGWLYVDAVHGRTVFDAVHTIRYTLDEDGQTGLLSIQGPLFGDDSGDETTLDSIPASDGVTMVAQWKYRQRFATQVWNESAGGVGAYEFSTVGGTISYSVESSDGYIEEDFEVDGESVGKDVYVCDLSTAVDVVARANAGYRFTGWYDAEGNLVSKNQTYSYQVDNRQVTALYARFMPDGNDLTITKTATGTNSSKSAYFTVDIHISGALANYTYRVVTSTVRQVTPLEGGAKVMSASSIKTDENGDGSARVYLKHGETARVVGLPDGVYYSVAERSYVDYGYVTSYNVNTVATFSVDNQPLLGATTVEVVNTHRVFKLQVTKNGLSNSEDLSTSVPLEGVGFTVYSDPELTQVKKAQLLTNKSGIATFTNLDPGATYYLKETFVPAGYQSTGKACAIKITMNGGYLVEDGVETPLTAVSSDTYGIAITNAVMVTIPASGSIVTPLGALVCGLIALVAANVLALLRLRSALKNRRD